MVTKEIIVKTIIEKAQDEYEEVQIKTPLIEGFKKPNKIGLKGHSGKGYIPDLILDHSETKDLYCVELNQDYQVQKWLLFSLYSTRENGTLNIVAPEDNLPHIREAVSRNNIKARILYFS